MIKRLSGAVLNRSGRRPILLGLGTLANARALTKACKTRAQLGKEVLMVGADRYADSVEHRDRGAGRTSLKPDD